MVTGGQRVGLVSFQMHSSVLLDFNCSKHGLHDALLQFIVIFILATWGSIYQLRLRESTRGSCVHCVNYEADIKWKKIIVMPVNV